MTSSRVVQFSGNGSFDHEADTREEVLVLVLPRPEEGMGCLVTQSAAECHCCLRSPQREAADAEIKVPSGENTELKRPPFKPGVG